MDTIDDLMNIETWHEFEDQGDFDDQDDFDLPAELCYQEMPMLEPLTFDQDGYCAQDQSPLFNLPGEIRDEIFVLALATYDDDRNKYELKSYHARPDYFAAQRSATQLLQTCQRAYHEAWFRPWTSARQTIWLTSPDRAPPTALSVSRLSNIVSAINSRHGDIVLDHFRVFAQLWALEEGNNLQPYLDINHFNPYQITITIRHTDFWWWESDEPLRIGSEWVKQNEFPNSLQVLRIDLESLERKSEQIDAIAKQMRSQWYFTRKDGVCLFASHKKDQITRWQGSSTFNEERWLRDEKTPGKLDYYIRTLTWRADPNRSIKNRKEIEPNVAYTGQQQPIAEPVDFVNQAELDLAGVSEDMSIEEVKAKIQDHRIAYPEFHPPSFWY